MLSTQEKHGGKVAATWHGHVDTEGYDTARHGTELIDTKHVAHGMTRKNMAWHGFGEGWHGARSHGVVNIPG